MASLDQDFIADDELTVVTPLSLEAANLPYNQASPASEASDSQNSQSPQVKGFPYSAVETC